MRNGALLVVCALAADACPVGDAEIVSERGPVLRIALECPGRQRGLEVSDGALDVVRSYPRRSVDVGARDAEQQLGAHVLAPCSKRPWLERCCAGEQGLTQRDTLLVVLDLLPAREVFGEFALGLLSARRHDRSERDHERRQ